MTVIINKKNIVIFLFLILLTLNISGCQKKENVKLNFSKNIELINKSESNQYINEYYFKFPKEKKALTYLVDDISKTEEFYNLYIKTDFTFDNNNHYNLDVFFKNEKEKGFIFLTNIIIDKNEKKLYIKIDDIKKNIDNFNLDYINSFYNNYINKNDLISLQKYENFIKYIKNTKNGYLMFDYSKLNDNNDTLNIKNITKDIYNIYQYFLTIMNNKNSSISYDKKNDSYTLSLSGQTFDNFLKILNSEKNNEYNEINKNIDKLFNLLKINKKNIPLFLNIKESEIKHSIKLVNDKNKYNYGQNITYLNKDITISFNLTKNNIFKIKEIDIPKDVINKK